jgi:hypothetical protein
MKANPFMERVYELLEQFDFKELSEEDRSYVMSEMSEKEYNNLRNTLKTTEAFFSSSVEPILNNSLLTTLTNTKHKPNVVVRILNQPVKLYQLAASILLILAIYTFKQYSDLPGKNSALPKNDTIFIQKTDTVYSKLADTVKIIKEKFIYISGKKSSDIHDKLLSTATNYFDNGLICPNHIDSIKGPDVNDNISRDTLFKN